MADKTIGSYDTVTPVGTELVEVQTAASESKNVDTQSIADLAPVVIQLAASSESSALATGTSVVVFRAPCAFTIMDVRASVGTASSSGLPTFDINVAGSSVLSTPLTIDVGEKTSTSATTPAVISAPAVADDAEITVDIDVAGTDTKGAKITIIGKRS